MKMSKRFWLIPIALLIVICCLVFTFWDTLEIYLRPKTVLTRALTEAYSHLQARIEQNPLPIALRYLDPEGKQTAELHLQTVDPILGDIRYDMQLQTKPQAILAKGTVGYSSEKLALSAYLDHNFIAVSSDDLLQGKYYGITYSTFLQDIRKIPLLSWMIGENLLQKWNNSVLEIQKKVGNEPRIPEIPEIPEISETDLQLLKLALAALPVKTERSVLTSEGEEIPCYRISGSVSGTYVTEALQQWIPLNAEEISTVSAAFYIHNNMVRLTEITVTAGDKRIELQAETGENPSEDPVYLKLIQVINDQTEEFSLKASRILDPDIFSERWIVTDKEEKYDIAYRWNPETGDLKLIFDGNREYSLNMTESENGLCIQSEHLSALYREVTRGPESQKVYTGTAVIRRGSDFEAPEFRNLDQWSMEDFLILLEGLGTMIGIRFD